MTMNTIHKLIYYFPKEAFKYRRPERRGFLPYELKMWTWRENLMGGPYNFICKSHKYKAPSQPHKATCSLYRITMTSSKETFYRTPWENRFLLHQEASFEVAILRGKVSTWILLGAPGCFLFKPFCVGNKELWSLGRDWLTPHNPPSHYPRDVHQTQFTTRSK